MKYILKMMHVKMWRRLKIILKDLLEVIAKHIFVMLTKDDLFYIGSPEADLEK